jgi:iron complex outermembrane recepter protein
MTKLGDRGRPLRRFALAMLLGLLSVAGTAPVHAQAADAGADQEGGGVDSEVVVTAFRKSLAVSLDQKRVADGAIDVIVAEDIADFPDLNLAEALQRIPGVSIQRDAGEGRQISVRGLGPEFTRVRLNGVEAMSANGGTDAAGGTNRARNFDFNTFAAELFNSITVRKTAAANTEEGSLGATVDLRTGRPFDFDGLTIATTVTGSYSDLGEDVNPRGVLLLSNTFADGKFGALVSAAFTERELVDEGASTVRWARATNMGSSPGLPAGVVMPSPAPFVPRLPRYDYYEHNQDRLGLTAALQFQPTDDTLINLDALYAEFNADRREIFMEIPNFSTGVNTMRAEQIEVDGESSVVFGRFTNVDIRSEQRVDELSTEFTQVTLDGSHNFTDRVKLGALVGFAESNHENPVQTTLLFDRNNIPLVTYDFRGNDRLPLISYGNTDLTSMTNGIPQTDPMGGTNQLDSGGWYLSQIRLRPQSALNSFMNYEADLEWQMTDVFTLSGGLQRKEYKFETTELRRSNGSTANLEATITAAQRAVPLSQYGEVFSLGDDLDIPAGTNTSFLIPDIDQAAGLFNLNDRTAFPLGFQPASGNNREVEEKDSGAFLQLGFNTDVGEMPLRGNVGLRYVETDQTTFGWTIVTSTRLDPVTEERSYSDTLPSLNVALEVTDELILRAAAAKVMSRPALGTLNPGVTVNVSGANRTGTRGNPDIEPTRADAYDVSAEWYFAPESVLSLALFYKEIESRPTTSTISGQLFSANPFGLPDEIATAACGSTANCGPNIPQWSFTTTDNGDGGDLKGFEVAYQQPFTFLPGFLKDFGVVLNYTAVESEIEYFNTLTQTLDTADLTGLSNTAWNATLYYEVDRFGARVSAAYRDEYLDPTSGVPGRDGNNLEGVTETLTVDCSARFNVTDSFEITFEGLNLTDEFQDQWVDQDADRISFYHHTGRIYMLGASLRF